MIFARPSSTPLLHDLDHLAGPAPRRGRAPTAHHHVLFIGDGGGTSPRHAAGVQRQECEVEDEDDGAYAADDDAGDCAGRRAGVLAAVGGGDGDCGVALLEVRSEEVVLQAEWGCGDFCWVEVEVGVPSWDREGVHDILGFGPNLGSGGMFVWTRAVGSVSVGVVRV